jgi:hypothetical protein
LSSLHKLTLCHSNGYYNQLRRTTWRKEKIIPKVVWEIEHE